MFHAPKITQHHNNNKILSTNPHNPSTKHFYPPNQKHTFVLIEYDKNKKPIIQTHEDLVEYRNLLVKEVLENDRLRKLEKLKPKEVKKK